MPDTTLNPELLTAARRGDSDAAAQLLQPWRRPLFSYIYRMITHPQDAEDLLQDVTVRVLEGIRGFRADARFETWLFGIATHVCLDHLRARKRWRVEAQLEGEERCVNSEELGAKLFATLAAPDFLFEIREHIAFCFSCVARTLEPEQQAALMLREVLGFRAEEAAEIAGVSEPVLRHRLSAARRTMVSHYDGLCQLINKTGVCNQCRSLREITPERNRGAGLVQIEVAPGVAVSPEALFDARVRIAAGADLAEGKAHKLHHWFFEELTRHEG